MGLFLSKINLVDKRILIKTVFHGSYHIIVLFIFIYRATKLVLIYSLTFPVFV